MKNKKGFTLIELLVVIAIIGLLSTLAVVALGSAREKSRDARRLSDIKQIQTALELFYTDNNSYPTSTSPVELGSANYACLNAAGFGTAPCADAYMGLVPEDPGNTGTYQYQSADGSTYTLTTALEGEVSGLSGSVVATPSGLTASSTP